MKREMFSSTTIASSNDDADREGEPPASGHEVFSVKPMYQSSPNVGMNRKVGMAMAAMRWMERTVVQKQSAHDCGED